MSVLLENIGNILTNILTWLGQMSISLIQNQIFIILMSTIIFTLLIYLLINLINEKKARNLAIGLTGSTDELEYYRSLSDEEKEEYNRTHI